MTTPAHAPPPVRALIEAGRRARLLDPVTAARLLTSLKSAGVTDLDALHHALSATVIQGIEQPHRLARLLATPERWVDAYQLLARLIGDVGESWLAADPEGELVLLRLMPVDVLGDETDTVDEAQRKFIREADIYQQLDHPNLVRCRDSGTTDDGAAWFAVEYLQDGDLATHVRLHGGRLDPTLTLGIGSQVADALTEIDRLGLVHRAVSPHSILVGADGMTKLGHFTLARRTNAAMTQVTASQQGGAGPLWMAPELVLGDHHIGIATDVYALGCVLFACIAGRPPFTGRDEMEVMHHHVSTPATDLRDVVAHIDDRTASTIATCLAKEPTARPDPHILSGLLTDVRHAIAAQSGQAHYISDRRPARTSTSRVSRTSTATRRRQLSLTGDLTEMNLGDLLQMLQRMNATGVLRLIDQQRIQEIVLVDGAPVGIEMADADDVAELCERLLDHSADPAALRALATATPPADAPQALIDSGLVDAITVQACLTDLLFDSLCRRFLGSQEAFEFVAVDQETNRVRGVMERVRGQGLSMNADHLLMEAARQLDEWEVLTRSLPGGWNLPLLPEEHLQTLTREFPHYPERTVIAAIDGTTALCDLHHRARCTSYAAYSLISDLSERGLLRWLDPHRAGEEAQELIAAGEVHRAEALARSALGGRPGDDAAALLYARCLAAVPFFDSPTPISLPIDSAAPLLGDPGQAWTGTWLAVLSDERTGYAVHLFADEELVLGKLAKPPVHLTLRKYPAREHMSESNMISRIHARLKWRDQGTACTVTDLESGNGTKLDGVALPGGKEVRLPRDRASALDIAGVVALRLRPIGGGRTGLPSLPDTPQTDTGLDAVALQRVGNCPEMAYALVRHRVSIGGNGADIVLPAQPPGPSLILARHRNGWWWSRCPHDEGWHPVTIGTPITGADLTLIATEGTHALYHHGGPSSG